MNKTECKVNSLNFAFILNTTVKKGLPWQCLPCLYSTTMPKWSDNSFFPLTHYNKHIALGHSQDASHDLVTLAWLYSSEGWSWPWISIYSQVTVAGSLLYQLLYLIPGLSSKYTPSGGLELNRILKMHPSPSTISGIICKETICADLFFLFHDIKPIECPEVVTSDYL